MSFKKFDGSTWQPITPKKLKGIPYTGTLPATLTGTKAGYLHRYKIYGNTEQTGTPTPENPIVPSECGESTANEAWTGWAQDFVTRINDSTKASFEIIDGRTCLLYDASAGYNEYDNKYIFKTDWKENTQYTVSFDALRLTTETIASVFRLRYTDGTYENLPFSKNSGEFESYTLTSQENKTIQDIIGRYTSGRFRIDIDTFMVNEGSTALPYEPYGFKLPLTSAGQSVDIYIGESQTTRRIGKIDLGTLNWSKTASGNFWSATTIPNIRIIGNASTGNAICDKFKEVMANDVATRPYSFSSCLNNLGRPFINKTGFEDLTVEEFKQAMSGVYMYYVLATEETGTLNEPLRKIGDYADTIDSTQTTAQIPTTAGSTTISWAGQGLSPSEFDSIQEWVDIPTYTYTNGEWVADNSN